MNARKIVKSLRLLALTGIALVVGFFVSIKSDDASRRSAILLDFDTRTASADVPPVGTSDSVGTADSTATGDGSGDSGSGDCGSGDADGAL